MTLGQAAEVRLGRQRSPEHEGGEHPAKYLRSANVVDGRLDLNDVKSMNFSPGERLIFALEDGDVLVTEGSGSIETVGTSAVWRQDLPGVVCFQNTLLRLRPRAGITTGPYLAWWARHARTSGQIAAISTGANIKHLGSDGLKRLVLEVPSQEEQYRIADFLDDRVARIDQIITARQLQVALLQEAVLRASYDTVRGEATDRRDSGLAWLSTVPKSWPVLTVGTEFQVDLGKMLDEKQQTGLATIPYLRNTNVQWDRVDTSDLKSMDVPLDERFRFTVRAGDLLICEGGQPGRAAIYPGGVTPLGFQKALHRARSRGRSRPEWLLECLRVAVHLEVLAVENGQTTIAHLTNEQLRALRFPFPPPDEQDAALRKLKEQRRITRSLTEAGRQSIAHLTEYKQSLITAAVTGELDVTTAGSGNPG